jgi:hypothetical protein
MVVFKPICKFQKQFFKIFILWVFFTCFKKCSVLGRHFVTACSACIGIFYRMLSMRSTFLPHAQRALHIFYRMLSMRSTFFSASSACIKILTVFKGAG